MASKVIVTPRGKTIGKDTKASPFVKEVVTEYLLSHDSPQFVRDYREHAWEVYDKKPLPTTDEEAWRRTDIRGLNLSAFRLPKPGTMDGMPSVPKELTKPLMDLEHGGQIILSPEGIQYQVDATLASQGVLFTDLTTAEWKYADLLEQVMGRIVPPDEGKFAAMAAAFAYTGIFIYIPRGVKLEQPLHSILWGPGEGVAYISHIIVWVDDDASLTYVHEVASPTEATGQSFHAGNVEILLGEGSHLRFVELQSWGENMWNFTHERAHVGRDANLDWIFAAVGSRLTKNFSEIDLIGEGAQGRMSGFYFTDGIQHLDHDTQQNHLAPNTTSDLLFKGALKGKSRSVWQGMIYVAPGAQKTDGYQANRNLLLSDKARADSIPGLEIQADDVRCTHGATVSKIDPEEVFYLRSRGIPYQEAERLIVEGFFEPIMQRIPFEGVKNRLRGIILAKMG